MKAVILAGGKGTRLGELTQEIPKPMLPIAGKPLLERHVAWLVASGITDIFITVNHLKEAIVTHFGTGEKWGAHIQYYEEEVPLGTVGGVKALEAHLQDAFLVVYGDVLLDMDLERLLAFHQENKSQATLVLHPNDHPYDSDLVAINEEGRVTAFHPKPHPEGQVFRNLVNAGVYVLTPAVFAYLKKGEKADFGADIFPKLVHQLRIFGYNTTEYLKDMGTPNRLAKVTADWVQGKVHALNLKNKQKAIFLDRDGVLNEDTNLIHRAEDLHIYPYAAKAVKEINVHGFLAIVTTNQSVIARNLCSLETLREIHNTLEWELGKHHAKLDEIYYCPHHPDKGFPNENAAFKINCDCRKPKPGMILKAANRFNIDCTQSYMIGDSERDIVAGKTAGCTTVGVLTGHGVKQSSVQPDYFFNNVWEAVHFITTEPYAEHWEAIDKQRSMHPSPFIIAVGGNSRAGKSTFSTYLKQRWQSKGVSVLRIQLDDWIIPMEQRRHPNDVFAQFQATRLNADLMHILAGNPVQAEGYARHPQHPRVPVTYHWRNQPVIIIEGVIALSLETVQKQAHLKIFKQIAPEKQEESVRSYFAWKGRSKAEIDYLISVRKLEEYPRIQQDEAKADWVI